MTYKHLETYLDNTKVAGMQAPTFHNQGLLVNKRFYLDIQSSFSRAGQNGISGLLISGTR